MTALCRVGWHRWRTTRAESIRYGVLVTQRCLRCPATRCQSRWP